MLKAEDGGNGRSDNEFYKASRTGFHFQPEKNWMNGKGVLLHVEFVGVSKLDKLIHDQLLHDDVHYLASERQFFWVLYVLSRGSRLLLHMYMWLMKFSCLCFCRVDGWIMLFCCCCCCQQILMVSVQNDLPLSSEFWFDVGL